MQIMELQKISKRYKRREILNELSFKVQRSEIVALVGENGSGKSTLLKIIAGLIEPDSGKINKRNKKMKIGYVPEIPPPALPFTISSYLEHMGRISGMGKDLLRERINHLLKLFELQDSCNTKIGHLSKGMKQKVVIMQAMLEKVELLILDEPLSGLDYNSQKDLETLLMELKRNGMSIIFTCHETKLLEALADRIFFLKDKKIMEERPILQKNITKNKLVFEIHSEVSLEELSSYLEIHRQSEVTQEVNVIEAILEQQHTDEVLVEILEKGASVKQLSPVYNGQEAFNNHFIGEQVWRN